MSDKIAKIAHVFLDANGNVMEDASYNSPDIAGFRFTFLGTVERDYMFDDQPADIRDGHFRFGTMTAYRNKTADMKEASAEELAEAVDSIHAYRTEGHWNDPNRQTGARIPDVETVLEAIVRAKQKAGKPLDADEIEAARLKLADDEDRREYAKLGPVAAALKAIAAEKAAEALEDEDFDL